MFPFSNAIFLLPTVAFFIDKKKILSLSNSSVLKNSFRLISVGILRKKIFEEDFPSFSLLVLATELSPAVLADFEF